MLLSTYCEHCVAWHGVVWHRLDCISGAQHGGGERCHQNKFYHAAKCTMTILSRHSVMRFSAVCCSEGGAPVF